MCVMGTAMKSFVYSVFVSVWWQWQGFGFNDDVYEYRTPTLKNTLGLISLMNHISSIKLKDDVAVMICWD